MKESNWTFNDSFYINNFFHTDFYREKDKRINKIKKILDNLDKLSKLNYEDESICKFIEDSKGYFENKLNIVRGALSVKRLVDNDFYEDYVTIQVQHKFITLLINEHKAVVFPDKYKIFYKAYGLFGIVKENSFDLLSDESFQNFKKFFSMYISIKKELKEALTNERNSCLKIYNGKLFLIGDSIKRNKTYKRFGQIYNKIIEMKKTIITKYIFSNSFPLCNQEDSHDVLKGYINELWNELNSKNEQNIKIDNYMDQRMLRLNRIKPKAITLNEKELYDKLDCTYNKGEFDKLYATLYTMFTDRVYIDEKVKNNFKTKKMLSTFKRIIDDKYKESIFGLTEKDQTQQKTNRDFLYLVLQRVIDYSNISLDKKVLSELTMCDFQYDARVINESINGGEKVSANNIYLPRLDTKNFHRKFSYPLVELTFNGDNIDVNEIIEDERMDGTPNINYQTFIYNYMSLDTYLKNATYIGKKPIENDFHREDSQDFSDNWIYCEYDGMLLIYTNGNYEIVSHETITMAGYDIPEPDRVKARNAHKVDECKNVILSNMIFLAESYRDKDSPLNHKGISQPIISKK